MTTPPSDHTVTIRVNWLRRVAIALAITTAAALGSLAISGENVEAIGPDQIIVTAQGATGAEQMVLRVNGEDAARWPVTTQRDTYRYTAETDLTVASVEVAFINDDGGRRDLTVNQINIAGIVLKSADASTRSTGTYVAGDGGCRDRASVSNVLHCNGSFTYQVPSGTVLSQSAADADVVIRARGRSGTESVQVRVNNSVVATETLSTEWQVIAVQLDAGTTVESAEVRFVNDAAGRDVQVDYLEVGGQRFESEAATTRSSGTHVNGECTERASTSEWLHCAGSFSYPIQQAVLADVVTARAGDATATTTAPPTARAVEAAPAPEPATPEPPAAPEPAPATGDQVVVRALGRSGNEVMQLRIDGNAVESWTVNTTWEEFTVTVPDAAAIDMLEVQYVNDASGRDLRVDYVELAGDRYQSESPNTYSLGTHVGTSGCAERASSSEWLHCSGWFRYPVSDQAIAAAAVDPAPVSSPAPTNNERKLTEPTQSVNGRYTIAQVIDGTIAQGDGSNPNEESPMGRHEAPLYLPQGWNWTQGPSRNSVWGQLGTGGSRFSEFRCAVIPENGHRPSVPFRINVRNGAYYQFVNDSWRKGFDVDLTGGNHGGYLGQAGRLNTDPFSSGSHGQIQWRREADGSFSAPWNANALMMHFWAGQRKAPAAGQTAEFLTSEVRLQQPDGQTVDLSKVNVLFQCGIDYYSTTGGQGTKVPGPGIAKYHRVTTNWRPGLWVTLPGNVPANSVNDFQQWLQRNTPPNVS